MTHAREAEEAKAAAAMTHAREAEEAKAAAELAESQLQVLRVYCAGAYSGPDVLTILGNMRRGIALSVEVLKAGFAPFCPWLDFQFGLLADIPLERFYRYSITWLEASDAVIVVPEGAKQSKGTIEELRQAAELNVPIFWTLGELVRWREELWQARARQRERNGRAVFGFAGGVRVSFCGEIGKRSEGG
jgi:hypothetical protein